MVRNKQPINRARSDTNQPSKRKLKSQRALIYAAYIRSKQFKEVKEIVRARQNNRCPICGEEFTEQNNGTCHHKNYEWAGYGGEKEADCCVMIHTYEHNAIHKHPKSFGVYADKNPRNHPNKENQSKLANAIRAELGEIEEKP